jgi:glycosyltransferase involved in cell wall biosynthesis
MSGSHKPLLLVISQVYVPDAASVGQHVADAAEALAARGYEVRVLTSARGYEDAREKYPRREWRGGVDVRRLALSSFGKRSLARRLLGQGIFLLQVIVRGLLARRLAGVLVSTSPPMASFAAVVIGFLRRAPITYWLMDMNPDQALALGKVAARSPLVWAMRWLNRRIFSRAASVVVLDRYMAERVQRQYEVRGRLEILPPWPHVAAASRAAEPEAVSRGGLKLKGPPRPGGPTGNPFIAEHKLSGRFVVMYSGNHSLASPVTTLVETALRMRDDPRLAFVFVGGGMGKRVVDEAIRAHKPANILSLPYQPLERLQFSLSAADVHVVTLGNDMVGIIHPCKIYGAMAVGRPVLLVGPRPSHAADIIERHGVGWRVDHGDSESLATVLRQIVAMRPAELAAMGERAREAVVQHYGKERLCAEFCDIIERGMGPQQLNEPSRPHPAPGDSFRPSAPWKAPH